MRLIQKSTPPLTDMTLPLWFHGFFLIRPALLLIFFWFALCERSACSCILNAIKCPSPTFLLLSNSVNKYCPDTVTKKFQLHKSGWDM